MFINCFRKVKTVFLLLLNTGFGFAVAVVVVDVVADVH